MPRTASTEARGFPVTTALEDHGMIGNCESVALITRDGSIDWLCLPRFDSPACCAALLGNSDHGHWTIAPTGPVEKSDQRYQPDTMVLETDLTSAEGSIRITDFMPIDSPAPVLVRIVTGLSGKVRLRLDACLRFDYGRMPPWASRNGDVVELRVGADAVFLRGSCALQIERDTVCADFVVGAGDRHVFSLTWARSHEVEPPAIDVDAALADTQNYWRAWIGRFTRPLPHADAVRRSLLTLKALIHRETGGLIAAPTTSLPEKPGGALNWDYRFCWLRDATFALNALVECGYLDEATAWRDWILRAVAGAPDKMQIVYRVDGSRRLDEVELEWLPGYRFAHPVRIGNAAADQLQLDVWGELIRTLHDCDAAGMERTEQGRHLEHAIVRHVEKIWVEADQGLWESRGAPRHYTYSKVMAWVVFHRFLQGKGGAELPQDDRARLERLRDHIHAVVCAEGFETGLGAFTSYFGSPDVDASLLLLPKVGFLSANDPRMASTIALIEKRLTVDGLVMRNLPGERESQGAFLACSFWLAECQIEQGRTDDARQTIERVMAVRSRLGLLSEEYDTGSRRLSGNFPQTLSHLALIHAVLALSSQQPPRAA